ncbi:hypothetical protein [Planotetraspora kaengkrachanensis]|uniref:Uncharacterized protein n=1 Tax=Planotetraspora kaengkrachanensis TaxID=575193 RepID=A0A8J3PTM8_9ACTN|nr:hypothetical protein [Planotetraspora kaengkrachanensis]GIG80366.1 hypothetical protein Pka01_34930 [Planotetraspora kaengkrachanensis]
MPFEEFERAGARYAVQFTYALPDDAWYVELSEAVPAPAAWADIPNAKTHLPGPAFVTAVVPDEDPTREPTIHVHGDGKERAIPYEVLRWYMEKVSEEVERCRAGLIENSEGEM